MGSNNLTINLLPFIQVCLFIKTLIFPITCSTHFSQTTVIPMSKPPTSKSTSWNSCTNACWCNKWTMDRGPSNLTSLLLIFHQTCICQIMGVKTIFSPKSLTINPKISISIQINSLPTIIYKHLKSKQMMCLPILTKNYSS